MTVSFECVSRSASETATLVRRARLGSVWGGSEERGLVCCYSGNGGQEEIKRKISETGGHNYRAPYRIRGRNKEEENGCVLLSRTTRRKNRKKREISETRGHIEHHIGSEKEIRKRKQERGKMKWRDPQSLQGK